MALKTKHLFAFIKMIKALGIKQEIKEIYLKSKNKTEEQLEELEKTEGLDYLFIFIEKIPNAEKEVLDFLAVYTGKTPKEVNEMEIDEIIETIKEVVMDDKIMTFFQLALK